MALSSKIRISWAKPLNSLMAGDKRRITLLADDKLDDLLDKLSGYVKPGAAHPAACPLSPSEAWRRSTKRRRAGHRSDFMTMPCQQRSAGADFVIVLGLQEGEDAFPAPARSRLWSRRSCHSRKIFRMRRSVDAVVRGAHPRSSPGMAVI